MSRVFVIFSMMFILMYGMHFHIKAQNIEALDKKKGFKDIIIGDSIQRYLPFFKYKERAIDGYDVFVIKEESPEAIRRYAQLGYLPIQQLNLLVYKSRIHEIRIFFALEAYEDLKSILTKVYAEPNETPCETIKNDSGSRSDCRWRGEKINLWCSAIDIPEKQKVVVGFSNFEMVIKMRKELTAAAIKDL